MSERKVSTRSPLYIDLAYNPAQPRDAHGRWVKTGASSVISAAATKAAHDALTVPMPKTVQGPLKAAPAKVEPSRWSLKRHPEKRKSIVEKVAPKVVAPEPEPAALRTFRKVTAEMQAELFKEAGIKSKFPDLSTEDLMQKWHEPGHSFSEREEFRSEIETRMKQLKVVAEAMDQSMADFARESKRDAFRKFDAALRGLPGGKQVINLRERILRDKVLDHSEVLKRWFGEKGKGYAKHVATVVAISALLHPLGLAAIGGIGAAGLLNVPGASEAFSSVLENLWVHSGLAVALEPAVEKIVGPFFKPFEKEHKIRKAKKFAQKHQTRRLHV